MRRRNAKYVVLSAILMFGFGASVRTQTPEFNQEKAWDFLLAQTDLGPRAPGTDGHYLARDLFVSTFRKYTDRVTEQEFTHTYPYENNAYNFANIIAEFGPESGERILLGAHWDTRPWADKEPDFRKRSQPITGANDGASGVAVLLELARVFHEQPPPIPVTIVLFDAEDMGKSNMLDEYAVGSRYYANQLESPEHYRYAVVVDMVGDADLRIPMEANSLRIAPALTRHIWGIADSLGYDEFENRVGDPIHDDHLMLYRHAGIPAVDIIDFHYPNRYQNFWHTLKDTPDKCSPRSLKIVGDVLVHLVYGNQPVLQGDRE